MKKFKSISTKILTYLCMVAILLPSPTVLAQANSDSQSKTNKLPIDLSTNGILYYEKCADGEANVPEDDKSSDIELQFPSGLDEEAMAKAIDEYIKKTTPDSILLDTGKYIVASSKEANVSPFLVIAHAVAESSLGKPGVSSFVDDANNSFGRSSAPGQPSVAGNSRINAYKWSSGQASVDHTAEENQKDNASDFPRYVRDVYDEELKTSNIDKYLTKYVAEPTATTTYKEMFVSIITELTDNSKGSGNSSSSNSSDSGESGNSDGSRSGSSLGKVYIVGDSITEGASAHGYEQKLKEAGATDVKISYSQGGNLRNPGTTGTRKSGMQSIKDDADFIKEADNVVIALGTNGIGHGNSGSSEISDAISAIKETGTKAKIYWVDVGVSSSSSTLSDSTVLGYNKAIYEGKSEGYKVISWARAIDSQAKEVPGLVSDSNGYLSDGVHPSEKGYPVYIETVIKALQGGGGSATEVEVNLCCNESKPTGSDVAITGGTNAEKVFNYLIAKGFTAEQAAAVVGNLMQESGGGTEDLQSEVINSIGAVGIVQWLYERKSRFMEAADKMGKPWQDIEFQIYFMGWEIGLEGDTQYGGVGPTHTKVGEELRNAATLEDATLVWLEKYEIPCMPGSCGHEMAIRVPYAQQIYEKYGDGGGTGSGGSKTPSGECKETDGGGTPSGEFVYYAQFDPQWNQSGYPMQSSGCGPTSIAMILATKVDKSITPLDVVKYLSEKGAWAGDVGMYWTAPKLAGDKWGMKVTDIGTDWEKAKTAIKAGNLVLVSGTGGSPFTSGGHIVVAMDVTDDNKVVIANPGSNEKMQTFSTPVAGTQKLWIFE